MIAAAPAARALPDGRWSRLAKQVIRPLWLRKVVRRIITQPLVWRYLKRLVAR